MHYAHAEFHFARSPHVKKFSKSLKASETFSATTDFTKNFNVKTQLKELTKSVKNLNARFFFCFFLRS